jgi:hypothetical protein
MLNYVHQGMDIHYTSLTEHESTEQSTKRIGEELGFQKYREECNRIQ